MLAVLAEQPRTGLGTIQALAARGCAGMAASAAEVYPGLMLLEETGFLSATGTRPDAASMRSPKRAPRTWRRNVC